MWYTLLHNFLFLRFSSYEIQLGIIINIIIVYEMVICTMFLWIFWHMCVYLCHCIFLYIGLFCICSQFFIKDIQQRWLQPRKETKRSPPWMRWSLGSIPSICTSAYTECMYQTITFSMKNYCFNNLIPINNYIYYYYHLIFVK